MTVHGDGDSDSELHCTYNRLTKTPKRKRMSSQLGFLVRMVGIVIVMIVAKQ